METKPRGPLLAPDKHFLDQWQIGGPIGKEELFILILSGLVLLVAILVGILAITSDLLSADQPSIRKGIEQRLVWFGETPNLIDDQQTGIRSIVADGDNQIFDLRHPDT